ncbi:MAG: MFS transporter [Candidatus Tectomicrobia bacterium]|uniref:MFS transporter n=1 Tax=Tectimicrobiota bacterium TaxID=2528274 RepID=A0A932M1Q0_UNCTE|nr:MFS transporter [Candidatus Tectomicrobia bacterium]
MSATEPESHYRWVVTSASLVLVALSYGSASAFSVFLKPLVEEFGWPRGAASLAYSFNMVCSGLFAIAMGAVADRYGTRRVALLGITFLGLGLILSSRTSHLWQLYLSFGLVAGGMGFGSLNAPLVANVTGWFDRNRGLATSITFSGTGLGVMVLSPLSRYLITTYGWRTSFLILGVLSWTIGFPLALLIRTRFSAHFASTSQALASATAPDPHVPGPPLKNRPNGELSQLLWRMRSAILCCCITMSIPLVHVVAYAQDQGIPKMAAATLLGAMGGFGFVGRILMGFVSDRIGGRSTLLLCSILQTSGVLGLLMAHGLGTLYLFGSLFGIGYGGLLPQYAVITREAMGTRVIGRTYGTISLFGTGGMAIGGALGGFLFDLSGTYLLPFGLAVLSGIANILLAVSLLHMKVESSPTPVLQAKSPSLS